MADVARHIWERAKPSPEGHAYLRKKQIGPNGAKLRAGSLVVPVKDVDGSLHSLQFISASGEKIFLSGGRVSGCCFGIGRLGKHVYVCEGFATGATIHETTLQAVVVALNAGNLKAVATALREDTRKWSW